MASPRSPAALGAGTFFLLIFAPFAASHFLSYVLRAVMLVLAPDLAASLDLGPVQVGFLTSTYFLSFALAQLPVGMALDSFGPRRVQAFLLPVAVLGCLWSSSARSFVEMMLARGLTGIGLSASFMASLKAVSDWMPKHRLPSMNGFLLGVGGLGAVASTVPVQVIAAHAGWRSFFVVVAVALVLAWAVIAFATPEPAERARPKSFNLAALGGVFAARGFRDILRVALVAHATYFAVQTLWLAAWLEQVAHLPAEVAAWYLLAGKVAMVVAMVAVGPIAEAAARRGIATIDVMAFGLCAFLATQIPMVLGWPGAALLVAVGFPVFGAFAGLEFALVAQSVPSHLAGRASTCLNLLLFTLTFLVQASIGPALAFWQRVTQDKSPFHAYQAVFAVLVVFQLPGLVVWARRRLGATARLIDA